MLTSIVCQLRLTMVSVNKLPLTWYTLSCLPDATLYSAEDGGWSTASTVPKYSTYRGAWSVERRAGPRRDGVFCSKKTDLYCIDSLRHLTFAHTPPSTSPSTHRALPGSLTSPLSRLGALGRVQSPASRDTAANRFNHSSNTTSSCIRQHPRAGLPLLRQR